MAIKETRRLTVAVLLFGLAMAACKRHARQAPPAQVSNVIPMDNPGASWQLVRGFYPLEAGAWRWTASRFSVTLRPPPGSARYGARLEVNLTIPEVIVKQLGSVTLSAMAGENALAPETYSTIGEHMYSRDVPASALGGDTVSIEFATDKAIPAGKIEPRELALIVTRIGLVVK